jgi:hypothetical protein
MAGSEIHRRVEDDDDDEHPSVFSTVIFKYLVAQIEPRPCICHPTPSRLLGESSERGQAQAAAPPPRVAAAAAAVCPPAKGQARARYALATVHYRFEPNPAGQGTDCWAGAARPSSPFASTARSALLGRTHRHQRTHIFLWAAEAYRRQVVSCECGPASRESDAAGRLEVPKGCKITLPPPDPSPPRSLGQACPGP